MMLNPFPGPQPFRGVDRAHFYGREDLSRRLEGAILVHRAVVVHGASGSGKSSLIQASVLPNLIDAEDVRVVQLDGWPPGEDPTRWLSMAMHSALKHGTPPEDVSPAEAVLSSLKRSIRGSSRILIICIDQLEQLFYSDRDATQTRAFFDCINDILDLPLRTLRVVMSLREDYLGVFRDKLRDHRRVLGQGFRVGTLTVAELADSMCKTALTGEPPQEWSLDEMHSTMMQARVPGQPESDDAEVQAAYGQIVCRALFQDRVTNTFRNEPKGVRTETILRKYFEDTLSELGPLREAAEDLLAEQLVTGEGGRTLRTERELESHLSKNDLQTVLRVLEGAAILRAASHQGSRYFELGHDWLARRVFERRQARAEEKERQRIEAERENERLRVAAEQKATLEKVRRERKIWVLIATISLICVVGAVVSAIWINQEKRKAEKAEEEATNAARTAKRREMDARDAGILAGVRELTSRGKVNWAMKLLPEVQIPGIRRGWVGLASELLAGNALLSTLEGHTASLTSGSFSPNGQRVLTSSIDGTARIWDVEGKVPPVIFSDHEDAITFAQWSHDGRYVLTSSLDGTARVTTLDGKTEVILSSREKAPILYAEFSPDDQRVVTASQDGFIRIHPVDGKTPPIGIEGSKRAILMARFSPMDSRVFYSTLDGVIGLWEGKAQAKPVEIHKHEAAAGFFTLSPNGKYLASASLDATANVWDIQGTKPKLAARVKHDGPVYHVAFDNENKHVATASADRTVRVTHLEKREPAFVHNGHTQAIFQVAFHPKYPFLATASHDGTARIFRLQSEASLVLRGHDSAVRSVAWNAAGTMLVTSAGDGTDRSPDETARLWNPGNLERISYGSQGEFAFHSVHWNLSSTRIAGVHSDAKVRVFARETGNKPIVEISSPNAWVSDVSVSPDAQFLATASFDKLVRLYRLEKPDEPKELRGHSAEVRFVRFSADAKNVLSGGDDAKAMIFSVEGTHEPITLSGHTDWLTAGVWSSDGNHVATASLDHTARIWKSDGSGKSIELVGHTGEILAIDYFPDNERVLTASADQTARIWKPGETPRVLRHEGVVSILAISSNGKYVGTYASDHLIRIWRTDTLEAPIELEMPVAIRAMVFMGDNQQVVALDDEGAIHVWYFDVDILRERIANASADCLPTTIRMLYLAESFDDAQSGYASCKKEPHILKPLPPITLDEHDKAKIAALSAEGIKIPTLRDLGPDVIRNKVIVLPTDAEVAVDGVSASRRQGVIEFVGKPGETRRIFVQRGAKQRTFDVRIGKDGAVPSQIDLNEPLLNQATGQPAPADKPANTKVEGWLPNGVDGE